MLLVHEVVAQAGAAVCDAPIGELDVKFTERRGNVVDDKCVEKANGCVPASVRLSYMLESGALTERLASVRKKL
jgi:hypothetical protein